MKQLKCSYCKEIKKETSFSINRANTFREGRSYACFICQRARRKIYLEKNPEVKERRNAKKREHYKTPEFKRKQRRHYYMKRYGITPEIYDEMLARQKGVCAICGENKAHKTQKYLHIDHNHKTGKVRELLCIRCNTIIGNCRENVEILKKTIKYIYRHLDET